MPTHFRLPAIVPGKNWPYLCPPNPHAATAASAAAWIRSFNMYDEKALRTLTQYHAEPLAAWSYRHASPTHYRLCLIFMVVFSVIDDSTDKLPKDAIEREVSQIKLVLRDPFGAPPQDEAILGKIVRSFWVSVLTDLNPPSATKARFLNDFLSYLESLVEEADDRQSGHLRDIEAHFHLRRETGGIWPAFDFIVMPFELPDQAAEHPLIKRMTLATGDLVIIANDIYSWNVEQAGDRAAHNIIEVVMREKGLDVQGAFDYAGAMYNRICSGLLEDLNHLPTFDSPVDEVVRAYVEGLVEWVQGNVEFSLASGRYFGELAGSSQIRETGIVAILPPETLSDCK